MHTPNKALYVLLLLSVSYVQATNQAFCTLKPTNDQKKEKQQQSSTMSVQTTQTEQTQVEALLDALALSIQFHYPIDTSKDTERDQFKKNRPLIDLSTLPKYRDQCALIVFYAKQINNFDLYQKAREILDLYDQHIAYLKLLDSIAVTDKRKETCKQLIEAATTNVHT